MPFGLNKSEKEPEQVSDPVNKDTLEHRQDKGTADTEGSGPSPTDQSPAEGQPQEEAPDAMAFRPTFLDSNAPRERAPAAQPPKGDAFFVSVTCTMPTAESAASASWGRLMLKLWSAAALGPNSAVA